MPGPVNSNYLQHRVVQEAGVWLLAACSRLCHATSTQDVASSQDAHFIANYLLKVYALHLSAGVYPCPEHRQSLAGGRVGINILKVERLIRACWFRPFSLSSASLELSAILMFVLLATYEYMLKGDLHGFHKCFSSLSNQASMGIFQNYDQAMLECITKMDLLYVLHFRSPPLFGSAFQQTMQPLRPEMMQDIANVHTRQSAASTSPP